MTEDALGEVADELYALPAAEFTAARNGRAKAAKAAGDAELAKRISALPRPSTAAWLVNQLVRADLPAVDALLELGQRMREAQAQLDAEQIRALTGERRRAVAELTRQIRALGEQREQAVSTAVADEVESTFTAALADPAAGTAVRSGRLTKALAYAGFGEVELDGAVAVPRRLALVPDARPGAEPRAKAAKSPAARTTTKAATKAATTTKSAPKADAAAERAAARRAEVEKARRAREVERADATLHTARQRLKDSEAALADLQAQLERARTRVSAAQDAVDRAQTRRRNLGGPDG